MLALRLACGGRLAVQLRRLLVAVAAAGTAFLFLCALGHALAHPQPSGTAALRLAWCAVPLAATAQLAVAVARTDPGTRPRPGLASIGLGPARLLAVSVTTTAVSCALGAAFALLVFLQLRGDLTGGLPFHAMAADPLAAGRPLPMPGTLTLLALIPGTASACTAWSLRGRHGAARKRPATASAGTGTSSRTVAEISRAVNTASGAVGGVSGDVTEVPGPEAAASAGTVTTEAAMTGTAAGGTATTGPATTGTTTALTEADAVTAVTMATDATAVPKTTVHAEVTAPGPALTLPSDLPWGFAVLAAGLAVQAYAGHAGAVRFSGPAAGDVPGGVLAGWILTAVGLILVGPGLTHLCGRLLQAFRPGALRLLAGRVLMAEAVRVGRPLGVVGAVAALAWTVLLRGSPGGVPSFGPLGTLGVLLVVGCTVATLALASLETRQARADIAGALLRLGAPATALRAAAALRAGVLLAVFGLLTVAVAELTALPTTG